MRVIVHDFGVGVNEYAAFGRDVPFWKPECCPLCGRSSLEGHGVRSRAVWTDTSAIDFFVRRLICRGCPGAKVGAKSASFTVLPCMVHPLKRYLLVEVDKVLQCRFGEDLSFPALASAIPSGGPAPSTQQAWCQGFLRAAPLWLSPLIAWLIPRKPITLVPSTSRGAVEGLLVMVAEALSQWGQSSCCAQGVLTALWAWGGGRRLPALLPPIRRRAAIRGPTRSGTTD